MFVTGNHGCLIMVSATGNHWVQQIVRMLLQDNTDYKPNTLSFEVLEYIPPAMMTPPDQARVFFTHLRFHHLPTQVIAV